MVARVTGPLPSQTLTFGASSTIGCLSLINRLTSKTVHPANAVKIRVSVPSAIPSSIALIINETED